MTESKRILVCEDDSFLRETIQMALEAHPDVRVIAAENGVVGIAELDKQVPHLVLLDLFMPEKDGYAVLQHIADKGYNVPVVILSNVSDDVNQARCMSLGAKGFLVKSDMDEDQLWASVSQYMSL